MLRPTSTAMRAPRGACSLVAAMRRSAARSLANVAANARLLLRHRREPVGGLLDRRLRLGARFRQCLLIGALASSASPSAAPAGRGHPRAAAAALPSAFVWIIVTFL